MRRTGLFVSCLALTLVLYAGAASAEEIIYFTNGTTMPIRAHEIHGEMIHVDLGSDAFMAFPLSMVEKIEVAGKDVLLDPSFSTNNRIMSGSGPGSGGTRPARGREPSRYSDSKNKLPAQKAEEDPMIELDEHGVAVYKPFRHSNQAGKRKVGAAGHARVMRGEVGSGTYGGTRRVGNRNVIGGDRHPATSRGNKPPVVTVDFVRSTEATGERGGSDGDSSSTSGSDSGSGSPD